MGLVHMRGLLYTGNLTSILIGEIGEIDSISIVVDIAW